MNVAVLDDEPEDVRLLAGYLERFQLEYVWNPVTEALISNAALRNTLQSIVTAVVTGGVAMIIIFAVDNKIFAPDFG